MRSRLVLLGLAVSLAACGDREPTPTLAERAASLSAVMNIDTLVVAGVPTPVQFQEISGASFPVPFSARMPRPIRFGAATDDESGIAVAFKYGQAPADAQVRVVALPEAFDEAEARAEAHRLAATLGTLQTGEEYEPADNPASRLENITTRTDTRGGFVWLDVHAGRYVAVVSDMALEASDDFAPRRNYLLRSWTWTDDGSALLSN